MELEPEHAIYTGCDGCETNIAAANILKELDEYQHVVFFLCVSHFANNTGAKLKLKELDDFFSDFIVICNHSKQVQKKWKEISGISWVGYGGVRWFNKR